MNKNIIYLTFSLFAFSFNMTKTEKNQLNEKESFVVSKKNCDPIFEMVYISAALFSLSEHIKESHDVVNGKKRNAHSEDPKVRHARLIARYNVLTSKHQEAMERFDHQIKTEATVTLN